MTPSEKEVAEIGATPHTMSDEFADQCQNWKGMDGAIAWHLIDRHADGWGDIGAMMDAWLRANGGTVTPNEKNEGLAQQVPLD